MRVVPQRPPRLERLAELAGQYPELDASAVRSCLVLLRVATDLTARLDEYFAEFGLSHGRFAVLMMLSRSAGGLSSARIAELCGVTPPTITGLCKKLEADGLVRRRADRADLRASLITLTPRARRLLERLLPGHFTRQATMLAALSQAERAELIRLLTRIRPGPSHPI
jgi:DNA-binding MarR family transcriptional regulator